MGIINDIKTILENATGSGKSLNKVVTEAGADYASVHKWLHGKQASLNLNTVARILDHLGATVTLPSRTPCARDVCFVDAKTVPAGAGQEPPEMEDYLAVPLVEEVGAGPGLIPQGELLAWFLVWRWQKAIQSRRDLIAVKIGRHSTSMSPTLNPGDIVLVDRQDKDVQNFAGRIMLVMDPEGAGKVKRVATEKQSARRDYRLVYYSDNAAANPPEIYSMRDDFENDWNRAIVGRVVWAWSDVSGK